MKERCIYSNVLITEQVVNSACTETTNRKTFQNALRYDIIITVKPTNISKRVVRPSDFIVAVTSPRRDSVDAFISRTVAVDPVKTEFPEEDTRALTFSTNESLFSCSFMCNS